MKAQSLFRTAISLVFANVTSIAVGADTITPEKAIKRVEAPRDKDGAGNARKTLDEMARDYGVPGFAIAVIDNFEIAWVKSYGVADVVTGDPVKADTLFQAASISKPVAAMASMKAVQDALFGLDDDVNKILKSWRVPDNEFTRLRPVTPRMLMSHTSGTDDGFGFPGYEPGAPMPTVAQILNGQSPSNLKAVVWAAEPFTRVKYSGGAVMLQQLALEDATGQPFVDIARAWVLDPIGMHNSFYAQPLPAELDARAARSHFRKGVPGNVKYHVYPELAAAGLWTTPEDLCMLAIEVQKSLRGESNRVLSPELTAAMVTPVGVGPFAVGFSTVKRDGHWYFGHGGGNWGVQCNLVAARDAGVGFAIMTNSEMSGPLMTEVEKRIAAAYDWPGYSNTDE